MDPETAGVARVPVSLMKKLRRFLQDYPESNELIDDYESTDEFLLEMLVDAALDFNSIEPITTAAELRLARLYEVNPQIRLFLITLATIRVLTSVSLRMKRNHITVEGANIQEILNDKWQHYASTIAELKQDIEKISAYKARLNEEGCWGSVLTPLYHPRFLNADFIEHSVI